MSTVAEIERAIEQLSPEEWEELRRWMDSRTPKTTPGREPAELAKFDAWLLARTGYAKGGFTTEDRMRETRGEV